MKRHAHRLWTIIVGIEVVAAAIYYLIQDYHHFAAILERFF
ncbi:MAG: hypothetical protein AVDCRST_MAG18-4551 [uncultured Thermomicrobiales bacterium]|uniref:Uncharacterized protein n=1 Tax=uncultured Thermomicrobiales bacterium TaxID=1645740 RepID=A0A6J4VVB6_9BACT|nr:MAG: hypothetical protein AVDCRST_MAG18-4551 [uncultured Thermomicrobiales bacterium]